MASSAVSGNTETRGSCTEHREHLMYFCITCNSKLCSKCFFRSHRYCGEVIELDQIEHEMKLRKAKLKKELDSLQKLTETCGIDPSRTNRTAGGTFGGAIKMLKNTGKIGRGLKDLRGKKPKDPKQLEREGDQMVKVGIAYQNMMKLNIKDAGLQELPTMDVSGKTIRKAGKLKREQPKLANKDTGEDSYVEMKAGSTIVAPKEETAVTDTYLELLRDATLRSPGEVGDDDWYQALSRDKPSGLPTSRFVGGVMIRENQLVHVFDERRGSRDVHLTCIDPNDTRIEDWRHVVAVNDYESPVVMSYKEMKYGGINHVLFAVGKTVFILHPQRTGCVYDSVHSVASILIDDVTEGSWITSIAAHRLQSECDEFLISVRGSSVLREYQISGKALRKIHTDGCAPYINKIAYVQNMFAFCGSSEDIYLITTNQVSSDGTVRHSGPLQKLSDPSRLLPVCVIWTGGAGWMALFVKNEQKEQVWRVALYNEVGKLVKICVEGTSPKYKGAPVSIARWRNNGFVSFADGSVKTFDY